MEKYQYTIHALFLKYRLENFNKAYFYANKKEKYKYWKAKELACSRKGDWRMEKVLNQILSNKKEARSRASPPAAGRFCDKILFRRMAILAERFYVIGRTFL